MNLMLTTVCNRRCSYCFARDAMDAAKAVSKRFISPEEFRRAVSFLRRSPCREVGLIGGEPTLHPRFREFLTVLIDKGFFVLLFTNGIIAPALVRFISKIPEKSLEILLNHNAPDQYSPAERRKLNNTLAVLGNRVELGFNIHSLSFNADFLPGLVLRYGLKKIIRLGVANPTIGGRSRFVGFDDQKKLAPRIVRFAGLCRRHDIRIQFDCGFTLCGFTRKQLGELKRFHAGYRFVCGQPFDIGPGLLVRSCLATASLLQARLGDFRDEAQMRLYFHKKISLIRRLGADNRCISCAHLKSGKCAGGCMAHALRSLGPQAARILGA